MSFLEGCARRVKQPSFVKIIDSSILMMFTDTTIYRSLTIQLETYMQMYKNMDKDYKMTIGKDVINLISDSILFMSDSYLEQDKKTKLSFATSALKKVSQCEIFCKALFDLKVLSPKQISAISFNFGQIKSQLYRWIEKLRGNEANGVEAQSLTNVDELI